MTDSIFEISRNSGNSDLVYNNRYQESILSIPFDDKECNNISPDKVYYNKNIDSKESCKFNIYDSSKSEQNKNNMSKVIVYNNNKKHITNNNNNINIEFKIKPKHVKKTGKKEKDLKKNKLKRNNNYITSVVSAQNQQNIKASLLKMKRNIYSSNIQKINSSKNRNIITENKSDITNKTVNINYSVKKNNICSYDNKDTSNLPSVEQSQLIIDTSFYRSKDFCKNLSIFSSYLSIENNNIISKNKNKSKEFVSYNSDNLLISNKNITTDKNNIYISEYKETIDNNTNNNLYSENNHKRTLTLLNYYKPIKNNTKLDFIKFDQDTIKNIENKYSNCINNKIKLSSNKNSNNSLESVDFFKNNSSIDEEKIEELRRCINLQNTYIKELKEYKDKYNKLNIEIIDKDEEINKLKEENNYLNEYIKKSKQSIVLILKREETEKKKRIKEWINTMSLKLCKPSNNKYSTCIDNWDDGEDILIIKNSLNDISLKKNNLEEERRQINNKLLEYKNNKFNKNNFNDTNKCFNTISNRYFIKLIYIKIDFNSKELDSYEIDLEEERNSIKYNYETLVIKEFKLKEQLEYLTKEAVLFKSEYKRVYEENRCRFGLGFNSMNEKWPLISNRYLVMSLLGKGGYSEVYKSYDIILHKEVAIKIHQLFSSWNEYIKETYIKHTIRENAIHEIISHKNIVSHYNTIGIDKNCFCTVLELCSGPDLATYLRLNKSISEKEAKFIISQILSGLKYLSIEKKIIHYDLKPENILFHNGKIKISDFGLSKKLNENEENIELTSQGVGTYWYLPPECFNTEKKSNICSKVDVWSLGVIFYELLYGKKPFANSLSQEKIFREKVILDARRVDFPQFPSVSSEGKDFIRKCLEYNVNKRISILDAYSCDYIRKSCYNI